MTFNEVLQQFKKGTPKPVYLLHGEEPFFIDQLVDVAAKSIIGESERDFNQSILYARETKPQQLLDAAIRLPLMAERQLIILKEAQEWTRGNKKDLDQLESYFENPVQTTVLIIAHKYKKVDKRSRVYKVLSKEAGVFESEPIKDYKLPDWVSSHIKSKGFTITDKAIALIAEFIGNDLGRIATEVEKLGIVLEAGSQINEKHIEEHIGISKDYNVFELVNAILARDHAKAQRIVNYFGQNPKATHITVVMANLQTLYQRLFKAHFAKTNDPAQLARILQIHPFPAKEIMMHKSKHPAKKISRNFSILREYDLLSKGVGTVGADQAELMREMVFRLLS